MPAKPQFKTVFLSVISLAILLYFFNTTVKAQSIITAIPTRVDLSADPGETVTAEVKVRNDTDVSQIYAIAIDDFIVVDSIGTPIPVAPSAGNRWALKSWVTAPEIVPVDAHGTQIVRLTFRVPLAALPGGHYAMITYQPNPDLKAGDLKQTANVIGQRVGTLLYLSVTGPITQKANLVRFTTDQFHEQGPVEFTGAVENLSDIHVNPTGTITIYSPIKNQIAQIPVEVGNVFPEIQRSFSASWNQKWGYGRYRADIELSYGTAGGILTGSIYFWLFPIRLVIYILVLIISIMTVIILLDRRRRRHEAELEREVTELKEELKEVEKK